MEIKGMNHQTSVVLFWYSAVLVTGLLLPRGVQAVPGSSSHSRVVDVRTNFSITCKTVDRYTEDYRSTANMTLYHGNKIIYSAVTNMVNGIVPDAIMELDKNHALRIIWRKTNAQPNDGGAYICEVNNKNVSTTLVSVVEANTNPVLAERHSTVSVICLANSTPSVEDMECAVYVNGTEYSTPGCNVSINVTTPADIANIVCKVVPRYRAEEAGSVNAVPDEEALIIRKSAAFFSCDEIARQPQPNVTCEVIDGQAEKHEWTMRYIYNQTRVVGQCMINETSIHSQCAATVPNVSNTIAEVQYLGHRKNFTLDPYQTPKPPAPTTPKPENGNQLAVVLRVIGGVVAAVVVILGVCIVYHRRKHLFCWKKKEDANGTTYPLNVTVSPEEVHLNGNSN